MPCTRVGLPRRGPLPSARLGSARGDVQVRSRAAGGESPPTSPSHAPVTHNHSAELRAAAAVRAAAFYTYPPDRSAFTVASHRRVRLDAEWQALEAKTRGRDEAWKHVRVACLVGTAPLKTTVDPLAADLDPSCKLPADDSSPPRVVLATLDVNIGHSLPAEELCGQHTAQCAYLSNVCSAPGARRMGAARSLVDFAVDYVRARGVRHLYVHVAADNSSAAALYGDAGFTVECEETSTQAHLMSRPRRQLLLRTVQ